MFLPHLAARLYGTPLLLARSKLDIILNVLGSRIDWTPGEAQPSTAPENTSFATRFGAIRIRHQCWNSGQTLPAPPAALP